MASLAAAAAAVTDEVEALTNRPALFRTPDLGYAPLPPGVVELEMAALQRIKL